MGNKIVIIGGSGLLGVNWAIHKSQIHEMIVGLNHRNISLKNVTCVKLNTTNLESIKGWMDNIRPDILVNAAGLTSVESCEANPSEAIRINVNLSKNLALAADKYNVKMVQISTDHLFSGQVSKVSELDEPRPLNQYGITKLKAEQEVLKASPKSLIIRTNFYGWGPRYRQSFTDFIITNLRAGNPIRLFSDVFYSPVIISVLVDTIHELIDRDATGIFNIVGDERISKYSFGKKLSEVFSFDENLILSDSFSNRVDLVKRPLDMSLSNAKVVNYLGKSLGGVKEQLTILKDQEKFNKEILNL